MTSHDDPHTLTGAYALHALDGDEPARAEAHLASCPACDQEVRELAETAARLGLAAATAPPRTMREEVLRRIAAVRQDTRGREEHSAAGAHPSHGRRLSRWALAACLAVAAALGGTAVWQHQQAGDAREQARQADERAAELAAVLAAPDARSSTARLSAGAAGTVVVSAEGNRAAFLATNLPRPPAGKVYQLWFSDDGSMRPAGLMDPARTTEALLLDGPVDRATGMGITLEPAGGSTEPTAKPVALLDFPG
ncbi:anti-sigma factor [Streptomyces sp. NPDC050658]|uniref:anti-sigma factor n=1 Tax=unclassified Streptomyces TaxID=2593676 RepID=UPI003445B245